MDLLVLIVQQIVLILVQEIAFIVNEVCLMPQHHLLYGFLEVQLFYWSVHVFFCWSLVHPRSRRSAKFIFRSFLKRLILSNNQKFFTLNHLPVGALFVAFLIFTQIKLNFFFEICLNFLDFGLNMSKFFAILFEGLIQCSNLCMNLFFYSVFQLSNSLGNLFFIVIFLYLEAFIKLMQFGLNQICFLKIVSPVEGQKLLVDDFLLFFELAFIFCKMLRVKLHQIQQFTPQFLKLSLKSLILPLFLSLILQSLNLFFSDSQSCSQLFDQLFQAVLLSGRHGIINLYGVSHNFISIFKERRRMVSTSYANGLTFSAFLSQSFNSGSRIDFIRILDAARKKGKILRIFAKLSKVIFLFLGQSTNKATMTNPINSFIHHIRRCPKRWLRCRS